MELITASIFELDVATIVIPVNRVGVMGKGLAKVYGENYPVRKSNYVERCHNETIGVLCYPPDYDSEPAKHHHILFPTKNHWRDNSSWQLITSGLNYLKNYGQFPYPIAWPYLGCGCGNLRKEDFMNLLFSFFGNSKEKHYLVDY
jgi:hypothetical protein